MENINYADFLIKRRSSWIKKSTTNLYCNLNGLPDIVKVLQKVGELQELRKTCFGHLLGFPKELTFSSGVLHNLLLRQIHVPGVTGANELHFFVGGKLAKFSQREFCLVTGLKFGVMSDIFLKPYAATKDGIHVRYFANNENIRLTDVWARFMAGGFDQPKDGLKMALVLIANNVLFGQDLRRKATLWLFQMVEDLEAFSSFPWGSYVYMMTIHYLRQGFRSANAPLKHIAHYNLYGFPWALEIWAMEAFGSLIDLVGKNLGHRHPRLKNWRIFKRPHDFFGKFAKYEKEVADGKHVVLEELHPTDDEKTQPYLVGVDTDLSEGPQFIALNVELDDGETQPNDDVDDDGNEDGNDSGNDGSQSRPQQNKQKPVKRKVSPHKQKMPARTKRQRTSPGMSPVGDDSTDSSRIMREVISAMSDQFEDIVKEIKKEISAMEDRLNTRLTRVEASLAQLVNQHRQSTPEVQEDYVGGPNVGGEGTVGKGVGEGDANRTEAFDGGNGTVGKRVGEGDATLTKALDGGDGTVGKGVSRGDNDQGGPDSTLGGGDGTFTEGIVGGDDTLSEGLQIVVHNILLQEGIVVQSHPPFEDDSTMVDYLAVKNEREQRLKITSRYMNSPYIDPFQAHDKEKQKLKTDYSRFKRSRKDAALNVGTDYYATKQFFVEMESPTCWLSNEHIDAYMSLLCKQRRLKPDIYKSDVAVLCSDFFAKLCEEWKKFQPYEDAPLTGEFDAPSYKCPTDWLLYASGDKPGWGTCWSSVRYLLVPCAVGDPDGHWILCVVDLEKRTVCIYDSLHRQKKIPTRRKQITPLLRFIPVILQESGYYQQKGIQPNASMFTVQQSIPKKLPAQMDNDSCGVFICRYTDMLMRHKSFWGWGTKNVPGFREEMALEIFANSVASY
ncbi:hypothetical protein Dsin_011355 [Dipteronia sinensis]|uniref:Ubiquitin-like protease family profile domain-containing protein n=1 Tax=Dipteronia sinensis TaxID=43782 RepID=A0AAE0AUX3_9ROSI|nr:hypothetical protein Dsin_011355 [Dipteronia sinensis]